VVYDVGCGDARVLIHLCKAAPLGCQFYGVEIDEERSAEAVANVALAGLASRITILNCNAMGLDYSLATHMFLYLVPRGLRIFKPILLTSRAQNPQAPQVLEVVTYMAPFLDESVEKKINVEVEHQQGSGWPMYLFHFDKLKAAEKLKEADKLEESLKEACKSPGDGGSAGKSDRRHDKTWHWLAGGLLLLAVGVVGKRLRRNNK
jgi:hypothetical protein